jgi:drug/metabolite transporter (DMT)-like permease
LNYRVIHQQKQGLLALHIAVLLFALSGLFAKWLTLPAIFIVFGRAFFAAISLAAFIVFFKKQPLKVDVYTLVSLTVTGGVLAFHWGSFFQAIQVSNVAIGLITFATFPVFVSFLEPFFFQEKFCYRAFLQALLTVIGIYLILPQEITNSGIVVGICWGIASALSFAILTVLNRKFVADRAATKVSFYQNSFAALLLLPFILESAMAVSLEQVLLLILLGVVFTAFAHSLFNFSLKSIKAQTASIAVSLEPIYGIIAAYFLLNEAISLTMMMGGTIVLATNIWALHKN